MNKSHYYLAVDVGGTKTLVAVFSDEGKMVYENRVETKKIYGQFLAQLRTEIKKVQQQYSLAGCCSAMPGLIDRKYGVVKRFGNLNWHDVPVKEDLGKMLGKIPLFIENDANLAGLSEANLVRNRFDKVMYLTISTGIKSGIIVNGQIDPTLADSEPGQMMLEHDGHIERWEDFASGRALVKRFGKKAGEIEDEQVWKIFAKDVARGLNELLAVIQPEVVILGGGVGSHYEKFEEPLMFELKSLENDMVVVPPIIKARRAEEAVIYGCYDFIKQNI